MAPEQKETDRFSDVTLYTDGGCDPNPGAGGYGAILVCGDTARELSGGFRLTTNNRMELFAAIAGLEALEKPSRVRLVSDSRYVVDAMALGWAKRWQANGWWRTKKDRAVNADLWERLVALCSFHCVAFEWVRGHTGHEQNERCDALAMNALKQPGLPVDAGYMPPSEERLPLTPALADQPGSARTVQSFAPTPPRAPTPVTAVPVQAEFRLL